MDNLTDILNNIKSRFTNPLFFSFLVSWLIINWEITIALFWYNQESIESARYHSLFYFIGEHLDFKSNFLYPLLTAIGYTLIYPIIHNLIKIFYTIISTRGENKVLSIANKGKIDLEKFLKLRTTLNNKIETLEEVIRQESEHYNNLQSTQDKLHESEQNLRGEREFVQQLFDVKQLDGTWLCSYSNNKGVKGTENVIIREGKYFIVEEFGRQRHAMDIKNFINNHRRGEIFFVKEFTHEEIERRNLKPNDCLLINRLYLNGDNLYGRENSNIQIEYKRIN